MLSGTWSSGLVCRAFYESSGRATYRLEEAFLYRSSFYDSSLQSILLYELSEDDREFVLTTPRLNKSGRLFLDVPHDSPLIDELSQLRYKPSSDLPKIAQNLGVPKEKERLFFSFFTNESLALSGTPPSLQYIGHACLEYTEHQTTVIVDPLIPYKPTHIKGNRVSYADLPETIDALVITHLHLDHFNLETLLQLRHKTSTLIVPASGPSTPLNPSPKLLLEAVGFKSIVALESLECVEVGSFVITALPFHGEHADLNIGSKATYKIQGTHFTSLVTADVRILSPYILEKMAEATGPRGA